MNDVLSLSSYINWNVDPINNLGREDEFERHCFLQILLFYFSFLFMQSKPISSWSNHFYLIHKRTNQTISICIVYWSKKIENFNMLYWHFPDVILLCWIPSTIHHCFNYGSTTTNCSSIFAKEKMLVNHSITHYVTLFYFSHQFLRTISYSIFITLMEILNFNTSYI